MSDKTTPSEKEPFDFAVFCEMYPNSNGSSRLRPNEADEKRYTEMYYADDSVRTISEFVDKLDANDSTA